MVRCALELCIWKEMSTQRVSQWIDWFCLMARIRKDFIKTKCEEFYTFRNSKLIWRQNKMSLVQFSHNCCFVSQFVPKCAQLYQTVENGISQKTETCNCSGTVVMSCLLLFKKLQEFRHNCDVIFLLNELDSWGNGELPHL